MPVSPRFPRAQAVALAQPAPIPTSLGFSLAAAVLGALLAAALFF